MSYIYHSSRFVNELVRAARQGEYALPMLGYAVASLQMYRFGAIELVPPAYRARAISWVTAGGVSMTISLNPMLFR